MEHEEEYYYEYGNTPNLMREHPVGPVRDGHIRVCGPSVFEEPAPLRLCGPYTLLLGGGEVCRDIFIPLVGNLGFKVIAVFILYIGEHGARLFAARFKLVALDELHCVEHG